MPKDEIVSKASPRDFFLYLAVTATLYVSSVSLLRLIFEIIDRVFPDNLTPYRDPYSTGIRLAIASLFVIFPLFLYISRFLSKDIASNPEKRNLAIRKWLIYFTLFIAGAAVVIDLIVLLNTFLGGEITTRFALKAASVLIVALGIFGFYGSDVKKEGGLSLAAKRTYAYVTALVVIASVVIGFAVIGSPIKQRQIRFDRTRVENLNSIQYQIIDYWRQKEDLPNQITELNNPLNGYSVPMDPETGKVYEYRKISKTSFELCADFALSSSESSDYSQTPTGIKSGDSENWKHDAGKNREIDPELVRDPAAVKRAVPVR